MHGAMLDDYIRRIENIGLAVCPEHRSGWAELVEKYRAAAQKRIDELIDFANLNRRSWSGKACLQSARLRQVNLDRAMSYFIE